MKETILFIDLKASNFLKTKEKLTCDFKTSLKVLKAELSKKNTLDINKDLLTLLEKEVDEKNTLCFYTVDKLVNFLLNTLIEELNILKEEDLVLIEENKESIITIKALTSDKSNKLVDISLDLNKRLDKERLKDYLYLLENLALSTAYCILNTKEILLKTMSIYSSMSEIDEVLKTSLEFLTGLDD